MAKCRRLGVATPTIYLIDKVKNHIYMEKINGKTVKEIIKYSGESDLTMLILIYSKRFYCYP